MHMLTLYNFNLLDLIKGAGAGEIAVAGEGEGAGAGERMGAGSGEGAGAGARPGA